MSLHVYGVGWADIVTRTAARAFLHVKKGRHFFSPNRLVDRYLSNIIASRTGGHSLFHQRAKK
jgi:hypothetical protein